MPMPLGADNLIHSGGWPDQTRVAYLPRIFTVVINHDAYGFFHQNCEQTRAVLCHKKSSPTDTRMNGITRSS
jgi:hypothetical protein